MILAQLTRRRAHDSTLTKSRYNVLLVLHKFHYYPKLTASGQYPTFAQRQRLYHQDANYMMPLSTQETSSTQPASAGPIQNGSTSSLSDLAKTNLIFQSGSHQQTYTLETKTTSIHRLTDLPDADAQLFKPASNPPPGAQIFALTTEATIFHPQGGGQPSDIGTLSTLPEYGSNQEGQKFFEVAMARTSATNIGTVLHFGYFIDESIAQPGPSSLPVIQVVDSDKRHLYSRLHTAGHVLGTATRSLLEDKIEDFDELKASHFPDAASCEFKGSIDGKYKSEIQTAVDQLVDKDAEVRIGWWRKEDFRNRGLERLLPSDEVWTQIATQVDESGDEVEGSTGPDDEVTRIRVVEIVGFEVYPCGGTHVPSTKGCGKVSVKKISRSKGTSRVSYLVD
ncbi:hypothetical protein LTR05_002246 [Lithohypha guttulata]|uniref:Threonyl/alanyl tRNA synthetase SAD domain-containing protein n=1 Tax=Lithohypha guttulata TaxID=1690604 RepID=A0AAN7Y7X2_9EURO|nr:hypothetical protein LTR05_002246 [Lithohypha guttulata]